MKYAWSLRTRCIAAMSALVAVLCIVFAVALHGFVGTLEDHLLHGPLVSENQESRQRVRTDSTVAPPSRARLRGYIARSGLFLGLAGILLMGLIGYAVSGSVVHPVTALVEAIRNLQAGGNRTTLAARFSNREVASIARAFDRYDRRLDEMRQRERSFSEDASHELRTSMAIVSSAAQLLGEEAKISCDSRQRVREITQLSSQVNSLIEALLYLVRPDPEGPVQTHDFLQTVAQCAEKLAGAAAARNVELLVEGQPRPVTAPPAMAGFVVTAILRSNLKLVDHGRIYVFVTPGCVTLRAEPAESRGSSRGRQGDLYLAKRVCERLGWRLQTEALDDTTVFF